MQEGNKRRKIEATDANAASSRSHAILEVTVCRSDRNHYKKQVSLHKDHVSNDQCMVALLCTIAIITITGTMILPEKVIPRHSGSHCLP